MGDEDDTFNTLKRIPFEEVSKIIEKIFMRRYVDNIADDIDLIKKVDESILHTGWTYDSYNSEMTKRAYKKAGWI